MTNTVGHLIWTGVKLVDGTSLYHVHLNGGWPLMDATIGQARTWARERGLTIYHNARAL